MIWEQRSTLVVMLTEIVEGGKVRCCKYWPDVKSSQEYGKYEVTNLTEQSDRIFYTRQLRLRNRMVCEVVKF
jgi:protein tyrosine phosphatase